MPTIAEVFGASAPFTIERVFAKAEDASGHEHDPENGQFTSKSGAKYTTIERGGVTHVHAPEGHHIGHVRPFQGKHAAAYDTGPRAYKAITTSAKSQEFALQALASHHEKNMEGTMPSFDGPKQGERVVPKADEAEWKDAKTMWHGGPNAISEFRPGTYFGSDSEMAESYATVKGPSGKIHEVQIKPGAKLISQTDLKPLLEKWGYGEGKPLKPHEVWSLRDSPEVREKLLKLGYQAIEDAGTRTAAHRDSQGNLTGESSEVPYQILNVLDPSIVRLQSIKHFESKKGKK